MPYSTSEKKRAYAARYRPANRERVNGYSKAYVVRIKASGRIRVVAEKAAQYKRTWKLKNPEAFLWHSAKGRALKAGRAFTIAVSDIIIPTHCPVLGTPLRIGTGKWTPNSPTLDRKNNKHGYVPGNVVVVSHRANTLKGDASIAELRKLVAFYGART